MRSSGAEPTRVLIKTPNWLGDLVFTLPALRALRRRWPAAHLSVLVKEELRGFYDGSGWIDEVVSYRLSPGWRGFVDRAAIVSRIRRARCDLAVLLPESFDAALWPALAGVPRRVGYRRGGRALLLTHRVPYKPKALRPHETVYRLQMLYDALGIDGDPEDCAPDVHGPHRARMREWLHRRGHEPSRRLVALAPGAAFGAAKRWPPERYVELMRRLAQVLPTTFVLVGTATERRECEAVAAASGDRACVAAGETGVGELIGLLSLCDAFVGNDSGATHVAAALGVATLAIYGSTDPGRTRPVGPRAGVVRHELPCSPCLRRTCRFGHYDCLRGISAEEVKRELAVLEALDSVPSLRVMEPR